MSPPDSNPTEWPKPTQSPDPTSPVPTIPQTPSLSSYPGPTTRAVAGWGEDGPGCNVSHVDLDELIDVETTHGTYVCCHYR